MYTLIALIIIFGSVTGALSLLGVTLPKWAQIASGVCVILLLISALTLAS